MDASETWYKERHSNSYMGARTRDRCPEDGKSRYSVVEFKSKFLFTVEGGVFEIEKTRFAAGTIIRSNVPILTF